MNTSNVSAAKGAIAGCAFVASLPLGSGVSLPTSASATLATAFKDLGFISDGGLTNNFAPSSTDVKTWGGTIAQSILTERPDKFKFALLETKNVEALKLVFGADNVSGTFATGITINAKSTALDENAFVFDMAIEGGIQRIVIPKAKISSVGDIVYKDSEATIFDVEITALPDADGNTHISYMIQDND